MPEAVVVPTYNERENVADLLMRVRRALPQARVLFVDDNSPDGTGSVLDDLCRDENGAAVLHRRAKEGLGAAYLDGFRYVLGRWPEADFIFQMDADLSHDPNYMPELLAACQDADLVVASRYSNGVSIVNWPMHRLVVSWLGTAYARVLTRLPITDCTSGFKCWRRAALEAIDFSGVRSNGYVFQIEMSFRAWRNGLRLVDAPIIFYERERGESKLHLNIALEALYVTARLGLERALARSSATRRHSGKEEDVAQR